MGEVSIERVGLSFKSRKGDDVVALNNLSLQIPDKQFAVIVGPSGCGKSSLLEIIAGLKEPTGGQCKLDGHVISGPGAERGMVFQNYSLFPWLTVLKNVEFGLNLLALGFHGGAVGLGFDVARVPALHSELAAFGMSL